MLSGRLLFFEVFSFSRALGKLGIRYQKRVYGKLMFPARQHGKTICGIVDGPEVKFSSSELSNNDGFQNERNLHFFLFSFQISNCWVINACIFFNVLTFGLFFSINNLILPFFCTFEHTIDLFCLKL